MSSVHEQDSQQGDEVSNEDDLFLDGQENFEEEEGEDLYEGLQRDYEAIPELDQYEADLVDQEPIEDVTYSEQQRRRLRAERELDRREGKKRADLPRAFEDDSDDVPRKRRKEDSLLGRRPQEDEILHEDIRARGKAREWILQEHVQNSLRRKFVNFLQTFREEGQRYPEYIQRIEDMARANHQSLVIDFGHLNVYDDNISVLIVDAAKSMLEILNQGAKEVVLNHFEHYQNVTNDIFVRVRNLPIIDNIRDIRKNHLNLMLTLSGVVTRRTNVYPQLMMVRYDCSKCGWILGPFFQNQETEVTPQVCPQCQSKGPFTLNTSETIYNNYQRVTLQESPSLVPPGRVPRHLDCLLLHDLIDCAKPGEEVLMTGIYTHGYSSSLNVKHGFPVFSTFLEANHVAKTNMSAEVVQKLTDEDKIEIQNLSKRGDIVDLITSSIAPSIYGHQNIRMALAMALFGGVEKNPQGTHRIRGDINVLLLGDPGTAKSQFLKYVEKMAPRAIYTTGKGASAVGLTASVHKDSVTREWTLEGGALVLADKGVCLIDEFDKMNEQDRVSIHEAMEQQSISVSKAGVVASLQARCSVIAAANPLGGRYDASRSFLDNVELTEPIISRFDVLCVVRDVVDPIADQRLAEFVVSSHIKSHPSGNPNLIQEEQNEYDMLTNKRDLISQELLTKYIQYAKQMCKPRLMSQGMNRIQSWFGKLRQESEHTNGMPITIRHLESIIRMAEAHAKMHLRDYVSDDDIDTALGVLLQSFISTQKISIQKQLNHRLGSFVSAKSDNLHLLMVLLRELLREQTKLDQTFQQPQSNLGVEGQRPLIKVSTRKLEERAKEFQLQEDLQQFYYSKQFLGQGFQLNGKQIVYAL